MRRAFPASLIVGLLAVAALCGAPLAAAAPSSNSAVNEYTERLPEGGGGQPNGAAPNGGGGSGTIPGGEGTGAGSGASPLPAGTAKQLNSRGEAGKGLSGLVQATGSRADRDSGAGGTTDDGSDGFLDSVGGTLTDFAGGSDTGLGAGFPILLVAVLAGAVAVLVRRNRRHEGPDAGA